MKGYRDKDGFHIVLEDQEGMSLIPLISEGVKAVRAWKLKETDLKLYLEAVQAAEEIDHQLSVIFVADNYREGHSSPENPIIVKSRLNSSKEKVKE